MKIIDSFEEKILSGWVSAFPSKSSIFPKNIVEIQDIINNAEYGDIVKSW